MSNATVIGRVSVKVIPDTDDFRSDAQRELRAIEAALRDVRVDIRIDDDQVRREASRARDRIQREMRNITGEVGVSTNAAQRRRVRSQLAELARTRIVTFVPRMNKAAAAKVASTLAALSGTRAFRNLSQDFADWIGNLDKAVPKIGLLTLLIANLSSAALAGTSNLVALGGSIATIGGSLLALPGILGGLAIGVGATIAVFRDFNKVLPEVNDQLAEMQDRMSARFWRVAEDPIRNLVNTLLPQFSRGMERTSTALGGFFANLSNSATGAFDGELAAMFDDLNESIRIAGRYTDNFVGILAKLGSVGAGNLPRLADWFGDISEKFDGWLTAKGRDGLQGFVDDGIAALKDLGGIVRFTGSMLAGLARAAEAAGGSTLASIRDAMEGVARTVNSASFQTALSNAFRGAHEGMDELTDRSGPAFRKFMLRLSDTLTEVLPSAGRTAGKALGAIFDALDQPQVQDAAVKVFDDLESAISNLAPSMPGVARGLAGIATILGDIGVNLSRALAPALDTLGPAVEGLSDDLRPLIDQLGDLLVNAVKGAAPVVEDLSFALGGVATVLADVLKPVNELADAFGKLPDPVKGALSQLTAIGILTAGGIWLGLAVRAKIAGIGIAMTQMAAQSTVASGAMLRVGAMAQFITSRMSGLRIGAATAGIAILGMGTNAAGANEKMSILSGLVGGALIGSAFGPFGAAVGVAAGALYGVRSAANASKEAIEESRSTWEDYIATLDQVTSSTTQATRTMAFDAISRTKLEWSTKKLLSVTREMGFKDRDIVDAVVDQGNARAKLTTQIDKERTALEARMKVLGTQPGKNAEEIASNRARREALTLLEDEIGKLDDSVAAQRKKSAAVTDYSAILKGVPKALVTRIEQNGLPRALSDVVKLAAQYRLTPKQVKTVLSASGIEVTQRGFQNVMKQIREVSKTIARPKVEVNVKGARRENAEVAKELRVTGRIQAKPKLQVDARGAQKDIAKARADLKKLDSLTGISEIRVKDNASKPLSKVKGDLERYAKVIVRATADLTDRASAKINAIRANLQSLDGDTATVTTIHQDVFTSRQAGNGNSPKSDGKPGLPGFDGRRNLAAARKAGVKISTAFLNALTGKLSALKERIQQVLKRVGDAQDRILNRQFLSVKRISEEYRKQMALLDRAKEKLNALKEAQRAYRQQVVDSIVATGDPTRDGASSFEAVISNMTIARAEAVAFAKVMKDLVKRGLNKQTLQQLVAAGPEAGLAAAQSILQSGKNGIAQVNKIQSDIAKAAASLGTTASGAVYNASIKAATQAVKQLEKVIRPLQATLQRLIKKLMEALAGEIKKGTPNVNKRLGDIGKNLNGGKPLLGTPGRPVTAKVGKPGAFGGSTTQVVTQKTVNYYAAPGTQSFNEEDDLFRAANRARMEF